MQFRNERRGATAVQVAVVLGVVTLVVIGSISRLGAKSSGQLNKVAHSVGNPNSLVGSYGNSGGSGGSSSGSSGSANGSSSNGSSSSGSNGSSSGSASGSSGSSGSTGGSGTSGSVCP